MLWHQNHDSELVPVQDGGHDFCDSKGSPADGVLVNIMCSKILMTSPMMTNAWIRATKLRSFFLENSLMMALQCQNMYRSWHSSWFVFYCTFWVCLFLIILNITKDTIWETLEMFLPSHRLSPKLHHLLTSFSKLLYKLLSLLLSSCIQCFFVVVGVQLTMLNRSLPKFWPISKAHPNPLLQVHRVLNHPQYTVHSTRPSTP